ncbi:PREDICTED: uncharacterized protein LOC104807893 [Tarenaya hassleriana]|uniref:uncharacterized protein LOC104807893 n=1 Tax=Tarenaya hassleriana TaxID=28532 RepID=UPI00053C4BFF|nr:PREDICTED: uncharacterized protein LOC104807893 [Tarenaya hassleriana]
MVSIVTGSSFVAFKSAGNLSDRENFQSRRWAPIRSLRFSHLSRLRVQQALPSSSFSLNGVAKVRRLGLCGKLCAEKGDGRSDGVAEETERLARGESTMPDRFRYLTKEAPDPTVRWPWFVALAFLVYSWRAVLFELSNWRKAALTILRILGDLLKLGLALVFHFIGDPITSLISFIETAMYSIRAFYSGIVAYTPIRELTTVVLLASSVLAVGEAIAPNSISSQPYVLTVAGLIGYAAVQSYISEPFFWTLLLGLYGFSRLIKKRGHVTSALPSAAVLAAVGEPWVRVMAMAGYLALAMYHNSRRPSDRKLESEGSKTGRSVPVPLLAVALAMGVRLAAKWAGYRHLTWMIV